MRTGQGGSRGVRANPPARRGAAGGGERHEVRRFAGLESGRLLHGGGGLTSVRRAGKRGRQDGRRPAALAAGGRAGNLLRHGLLREISARARASRARLRRCASRFAGRVSDADTRQGAAATACSALIAWLIRSSPSTFETRRRGGHGSRSITARVPASGCSSTKSTPA